MAGTNLTFHQSNQWTTNQSDSTIDSALQTWNLKANSSQLQECSCLNCKNDLAGLPPIYDQKGRKQHLCHYEGCKKAYVKPSRLKVHLRWHTGERPFTCSWSNCGKGFTRSDEVQRHLRTHTGQKQYFCHYAGCEKAYETPSEMKDHFKWHSAGDKTFTCTWSNCGKRFLLSRELTRHSRIHTGEKKFTCSECQKKFMRKDHFLEHSKTHEKRAKPSNAPTNEESSKMMTENPPVDEHLQLYNMIDEYLDSIPVPTYSQELSILTNQEGQPANCTNPNQGSTLASHQYNNTSSVFYHYTNNAHNFTDASNIPSNVQEIEWNQNEINAYSQNGITTSAYTHDNYYHHYCSGASQEQNHYVGYGNGHNYYT